MDMIYHDAQCPYSSDANICIRDVDELRRATWLKIES